MIRILHIEGATDGVGGSFFSLDGLVRGMDPAEFQSTVMFGRPNPVSSAMEADGWPIRFVGSAMPRLDGRSRSRFHASLCRATWWAVQEIRRLEVTAGKSFDVVHTNDQLETNAPWILASSMLGRPTVVHERQAGNFRWAHRALSRFVSVHVRVSRFIDDHCRAAGLRPANSAVIHNAVGRTPVSELASLRRHGESRLREMGIEAGSRVLLAPGTVAPWKGTVDVVRALSILSDPSVHVVFAGGESADRPGYSGEVRDAIRMCGLQDRVHMVGFRADIRELMAASDAVVHASRRPEPFGRVPLEAMALSRPVIATDSGGIPEVIPENVGWRVRPGAPAAMADAMSAVFGASGHRARLERGVAIARDEFGWDEHVQKMSAVFRKSAQER